MQEAIERATETRTKKLSKVLTPEQFRVWSVMEHERVKAEQERMKRRPEGVPQGGGVPGGGPQGGERPTPPQFQR